jgi:hypothetical protein
VTQPGAAAASEPQTAACQPQLRMAQQTPAAGQAGGEQIPVAIGDMADVPVAGRPGSRSPGLTVNRIATFSVTSTDAPSDDPQNNGATTTGDNSGGPIDGDGNT